MNNNPHVTTAELIAFKEEFMTMEEKQAFLQHICSCNHCSDQLAAFMAEDIIPAPRDMKENILKATKRPEIQIAIKSREASKRIQLLLYSLKVGTAAVAAIALLLLSMNFQSNLSDAESFTNINMNKEDNVSLTDTIRDNMNNISKNMLDFSNNIIKMEVTDHDQKEE
ncbi:MAG: hypothetical protein K0R34_818 [Herbinix sp.]|jgi:hypothetical protein|nr:hypothetical protein [Herbinix sp.]